MGITEAQKEDRSRYLGSSDLPVILGKTPEAWGSPEDIRLHKTGHLLPEPEPGANDPRTHGTIREPAILNWAETQIGKLRRNVFRRNGVFGCHVDAIALGDDGKPVEAKYSPRGQEWGRPGTDEVPEYVIIQCHVHMLCTRHDYCYVPADVRGSFGMYHVERSANLADWIQDFAEQWWEEHVVQDKPCGEPPTMRSLALLKRVPNKTAEVNPELFVEHEIAKAERTAAEKRVKAAKQTIIAAMGNAEAAWADGMDFEYTYMESEKQGYTVKPQKSRKFQKKKIQKGDE